MKKNKKRMKGKKGRSGAGGDEGGVDSEGGLYDSDGAGGGPVVDIVAEDMPEGALPSDEEDKGRHANDPHRLLDFELESLYVNVIIYIFSLILNDERFWLNPI